MSAETRSDWAAPQANIAVVIALGVEKACLEAELEAADGVPIRLQQSGPGALRAERAAREAVAAGATALVSWGLAGGLEPGMVPGTVVVPSRIIAPDGEALTTDAVWRARLLDALRADFLVHEGDLLVAEQVLETPRMKARAAVESGGSAVDMESAAIARVACDAGLPVVAVRVVADCLTDTLPADIEQWIGESGQRRLAPVLSAMLKPQQWRDLVRLAKRYRIAERTLSKLARRLVHAGFAYSTSGIQYS